MPCRRTWTAVGSTEVSALRFDMREVLSLSAANPEATKRVRAKFAAAVKAVNSIEDDGIRGVLRERLRTEYERQIAGSAN